FVPMNDSAIQPVQATDSATIDAVQHRDPRRRTMRRTVVALLIAEAVVVASIYCYEAVMLRVRQGAGSFKRGTEPPNPWLHFNAPGIDRPPIVAAGDAGLNDNEEVIGVDVRGKARAYRLSALLDRQHHVVNDLIDGVPVTVTYCDLSNCLRV